MTITTMKEARERCAALGITPARSLAETLDRISVEETINNGGYPEGYDGVPEPIAALAQATEDMLAPGMGLVEIDVEGSVRHVDPEDVAKYSKLGHAAFDRWSRASELVQLIQQKDPVSYQQDMLKRLERDRHEGRQRAVSLAYKQGDPAAAQVSRRLARKQMRKATKRAQRRRAA